MSSSSREISAASRANTPREGHWIAKPLKPRWTFQMLVSGGGLLALVPQLIDALDQASRHVKIWSGISIGSLAFGLGAVFVVGLTDLFSIRRQANDRAMMDDNFGEQVPVEVSIVVEGKNLGCDRGVAWFADGLFGFSGNASSFVLARRDVSRRISLKSPSSSQRTPEGALVLVGAPKDAYLTVRPLLGYGKVYRGCLASFLKPTGPEDERSRSVDVESLSQGTERI